MVEKKEVKNNTNIHDEVKKLLVNYYDKTGVAIMYVHMNWYDMLGGRFSPADIKIESKKY